MKKIILSVIATIIIFFPLLTLTASANDALSSSIALKSGYGSATTATTFSQKIGTVIKGALSLIGIIFVTLIIYAGFLWMTAAGSEEKVSKATGIIKMATIGLIIIVSAYSLTYFILEAITGAAGGGGGGGDQASAGGCCIDAEVGLLGAHNVRVASQAECTAKCSSCTYLTGNCPST